MNMTNKLECDLNSMRDQMNNISDVIKQSMINRNTVSNQELTHAGNINQSMLDNIRDEISQKDREIIGVSRDIRSLTDKYQIMQQEKNKEISALKNYSDVYKKKLYAELANQNKPDPSPSTTDLFLY